MTSFLRKNLSFFLIGLSALFGITWWLFASKGSLDMAYYPSSTEIRALPHSDLTSLVSLHQECFEDVRREKLLAFIRTHSPTMQSSSTFLLMEKIERLIQEHRLSALENMQNGSHLYVARQGSQIVGLFNCHDDNKYTDNGVMIVNVCLSKKLRGQGLGKQMMTHAVQHCQKPGKVLALTVYKDHKATIGLYKKLGFSITEPLKPQDDGFDYFDKYFMLFTPNPPESNEGK